MQQAQAPAGALRHLLCEANQTLDELRTSFSSTRVDDAVASWPRLFAGLGATNTMLLQVIELLADQAREQVSDQGRSPG